MRKRPRYRGVLHGWACFVAIPLAIGLVVIADGVTARLAVAVYGLSLVFTFGISAVYHRLANTLRARFIMQRLDHSMIYLLIVGSYAPICLVALPWKWGAPVFAIVVSLAVLGVIIKMTGSQRWLWLGYALYPIMGWVAASAFPVMYHHLTRFEFVFVLVGGLLYTVGFPLFLLKRPNLWPSTFGYHEVWHIFTVVAAGFHMVAVASIIA